MCFKNGWYISCIVSRVHKFNGKYYKSWSDRVLPIFEFIGLDKISLDKEHRPTNDPKDYDKRHKKGVNSSKAISYKHISFRNKKFHCSMCCGPISKTSIRD